MIITATTKRIFISNKNAFHWDAYRPQQWPSLPGGMSAPGGGIPADPSRVSVHTPVKT